MKDMEEKFKIYEDYEFHDKRIGERLEKVLNNKMKAPQLSLRGTSENPYEAKAAYRLLGNPKMGSDDLVNALHQEGVQRIKESAEKLILVPQDTTSLNFSHLNKTEGLGYIGDTTDIKGVMLHSAIAVTPAGIPLGMLHCEVWERKPENIGSKKDRKSKPITEKESFKWLETVEKASIDQPEDVKYIHLCDREGDIYTLFSYAIKNNQHFIIRNIHNRKMQGKNEEKDYILEHMKKAAEESTETILVQIPRDSHTKREKRNATVKVSFEKIRLHKPENTKDKVPETLELYSICVLELDAPEGVKALEWHLLTTEEVNSLKDAEQILSYYTQRWKIELFHRVLKEGCNVEKLQESTVERLEKAILLYSIVAVNILMLTYLGRYAPNLPCTVIFSKMEWQVLYRFSHHRNTLPSTEPTLYEAVIMIAKLAGFGGRPSDGDPGIKVLWIGYQKFSAALEFAQCILIP